MVGCMWTIGGSGLPAAARTSSRSGLRRCRHEFFRMRNACKRTSTSGPYPTGVEPNLAVQGFSNKFDQLDAQLYPEVCKTRRFFDAVIAVLVGYDFLARRMGDILAEDKWNALTMEQALRFLNTKGSEGLLPRSTGGTGGGGSGGNAGGGAAGSAGTTNASGSSGGGGGRNKTIMVPAHVLAPAKGKGGKAGGGGGGSPTLPDGSG
ncbi:hypothetical protein VaNZ11_015272, partial [Volvox africanus]